MKGIDVSVWNGDVDFKKVKESGIDFVIIRAGYGSLLKQKDIKFEDNYRKAKEAGLLTGFYWYSYGEETQDFVNEAKTCLEVIGDKEHELPIYFDLEEQSQLKRGKDFCSDAVKTFCSEINKAGKEAGLYISRYYLQTVIDDEIKKWKHLWIAEYDLTLHYDGPYEIWQKTSVADVPGVTDHCDLNESTVAFSLPEKKDDKKEDDIMSRQSAYNKMKSEVLGKAFDIDGYYGAQCPVKGTLVSMADGTYKPVEDLKVGEKVSTGNTVITNKQRTSKILKVKTDCGIFRVSPDHKFILADGAEVKACDLAKGDRITLNTQGKEDPQTNLSDDELLFLGIYLADGTKKYRYDYSQIPEIFVTVGTDEKIDFLRSLQVDLKETTHSNGKAKIFKLVNQSHPELASLINYMEDKKLPTTFSDGEYLFIIEGYVTGDGSKKHNSFVCTSVCKELLASIQYGCLINGIRASLSGPTIREETNYCDHPKPLYRLTINSKHKPEGKVRWVKEDGEDIICVLNLDGNHLYYGDNHLHHNCWDFAAYVMQHYYGGKAIHCGQTGYVKDIANQRATNGILNFMKDVGLSAQLQPGDICIWGNCSACPSSHIAIYDHDNGQGAVFFLGQNQGGYGVTIKQIPVNGIIGVFRPNHIVGEGSTAPAVVKKTAQPVTVLNSIPSDFHRENATFHVTVDKIKIRQAPSIAGKDTGLTYNKGMAVNYDGYVVREGYIWISWIGQSGTRRWMACGTKDVSGKVNHWGTFS